LIAPLQELRTNIQFSDGFFSAKSELVPFLLVVDLGIRGLDRIELQNSLIERGGEAQLVFVTRTETSKLGTAIRI
jgi:FixJ family two-component response regulator